MTIIGDGTGHTFTAEANVRWLATTPLIIEAYSRARYFLDQAITRAELRRTTRIVAGKLGRAPVPGNLRN